MSMPCWPETRWPSHDLEAAYRKTALGQDIYTQNPCPGTTIISTPLNRVRLDGSIPAFIEKEGIGDGIIYSCVKKQVPFVLVGSIRDDGPLPEVYGDVYEGQNAMRECVKKSTTVICMATTLHSIATGNMTPSYHVLGGRHHPPCILLQCGYFGIFGKQAARPGQPGRKNHCDQRTGFCREYQQGAGIVIVWIGRLIFARSHLAANVASAA